jgi:hypothetical protein
MKQWPKVGSKVRFKHATMHWYKSVIQNAQELLEPEKEYTLSRVSPHSSWCAVELEEFPSKTFSLSFFEYPSEAVLKETHEAS